MCNSMTCDMHMRIYIYRPIAQDVIKHLASTILEEGGKCIELEFAPSNWLVMFYSVVVY